jgi:hypothetical protein
MKEETMEKASIVVPRELYAKARQAAEARGVSFCCLIRRLLQDHLDEYLGAAKGEETPRERWLGAAPGDPLGEAVAAAADLWRLSPDDLVRLIVADNLAAYAERGRVRWEEARVLAQGAAGGKESAAC